MGSFESLSAVLFSLPFGQANSRLTIAAFKGGMPEKF
jgi:hypothetical protein